MRSLLKISHPCITLRLLCHFPRILKWRYATWLLFTHNCWGIIVSSWKFSFFFTMYPLFIVGKKPGGQMTVLYLLTKYLQTFYFLSVFDVSTTVFITHKKCITAIHNSANSFWHITSNIEHIHSLYRRFPDHTFC